MMSTSIAFMPPPTSARRRQGKFHNRSDILRESHLISFKVLPAHLVRFLLTEDKREQVMAIVHSKRYHQVNRAVFNSATTAAVLGLLAVLLGLVEPQIGASVGFVGVMTAYFAGLNLVCEKTCNSE